MHAVYRRTIDCRVRSKITGTSVMIPAELILRSFHHFTYVTAHSPTLPSLYLRHSAFSNPSVASPTSQLILKPFFRFSYITGSSLTSSGEPPMLLLPLCLSHVWRRYYPRSGVSFLDTWSGFPPSAAPALLHSKFCCLLMSLLLYGKSCGLFSHYWSENFFGHTIHLKYFGSEFSWCDMKHF